jgi:hypothetical protein
MKMDFLNSIMLNTYYFYTNIAIPVYRYIFYNKNVYVDNDSYYITYRDTRDNKIHTIFLKNEDVEDNKKDIFSAELQLNDDRCFDVTEELKNLVNTGNVTVSQFGCYLGIMNIRFLNICNDDMEFITFLPDDLICL